MCYGWWVDSSGFKHEWRAWEYPRRVRKRKVEVINLDHTRSPEFLVPLLRSSVLVLCIIIASPSFITWCFCRRIQSIQLRIFRRIFEISNSRKFRIRIREIENQSYLSMCQWSSYPVITCYESIHTTCSAPTPSPLILIQFISYNLHSISPKCMQELDDTLEDSHMLRAWLAPLTVNMHHYRNKAIVLAGMTPFLLSPFIQLNSIFRHIRCLFIVLLALAILIVAAVVIFNPWRYIRCGTSCGMSLSIHYLPLLTYQPTRLFMWLHWSIWMLLLDYWARTNSMWRGDVLLQSYRRRPWGGLVCEDEASLQSIQVSLVFLFSSPLRY